MTAAKLSFRKMVPDDADAVARVEAACFPVPWSRESFWREASNENTSYILAIDETTGEVVGYAGCWILADEAQITKRCGHAAHGREHRGGREARCDGDDARGAAVECTCACALSSFRVRGGGTAQRLLQ